MDMIPQLRYSQWKNEHKCFLETLVSKHVVLLFSGGNDSSVAMDFILRAGREFGFGFEAHAGAFPVHRYTDEEVGKLSSYWHERGVDIVWHKLAQTDERLMAAKDPCVHCQRFRREMLTTLLSETVSDWKHAVLIAGYSLWDLISYAIEHILADAFGKPEEGEHAVREKRHLEIAQRFHLLLTMKEGYTVFRPLIRYNQNDIVDLVLEAGIPILSIPCKFDRFRPKRILQDYYQGAGLRFDYDRLMAFAEKHLNLPDVTMYTSLEKEEYLCRFF